ncbi:MAG: hypothetical protein ABI472_25560 [Ginsengibacter sp.]
MNRLKQILSSVTIFLLLSNISLAQRNALKWPFSKTSIWNMPIHKDAHYVPANIIIPKYGISADEDYLVLNPTAPITNIYTNHAGWDRSKDRCLVEGDLLFSAPIPSGFVINKNNWLGATPNAGLAVLMPDGRTIKQTQPFARCAAGGDATSEYVFKDQDIYGTGEAGAHGASGMSAIGGTVRLGELVPGGVIRHALKINLYCHTNVALNQDGTPGYRWPATSADGYAADSVNNPTGYYNGKISAMEIGALVAIPDKINIHALQFETPAAKILATAFQNFGAYIVDDTYYEVLAIETEFSPEGRMIDEFKKQWGFDFESNKDTPWNRDINKILIALQVVNNNTAATIGGGNTNDFKNRLAPMSPDLVQPKHTRIMPLGNSITEHNDPGYRGYLYEKLKANGYDVDFVGTKKGLPSNGGDEDHSGYGGFIVGPGTSKGDAWEPPYKGNIFDNLDGGYKILSTYCDVIILEIGINDFFNSTDTAYHPEISNITPLGGEANFASLWNSQVPAIVAKYKKLGLKCYLANLRNSIQWNISRDLGPDNLHPQAAGYKKMADLYYKILTGILSK